MRLEAPAVHPVDLAHAAGAERGFDLEAAQAGTGLE